MGNNPRLLACKEAFFSTLTEFARIPESLKQALDEHLDYLVLPKHHIILEPPQVSDTLYYVCSGFAMTYTLIDRKKITKTFCKPGQLAVSFRSIFNQTPTQEYIQTVEPCEMIVVKYASILKIIGTFPESQALYFKIMNYHHLQCLNRIEEIQNMTAIERFDKLLINYPGLEQQVSQESIAYFLGITPQSLSRLKRQHG